MKLNDSIQLNLLREIVVSEFKLKDQSTFFGFIWSFMNPLIMLTFIFIIFSIKFGHQVDHYGIYLLIGIIQFTYFSKGTSAGMRVLSSMKQLTRNTIFPKELLVIGSVLSNTVEFVLGMSVCILIAFFSGVKLSWSMIILPSVLVLELMLVLWVSLFLSCLYVFMKDIGNIYQVFLRVLFFITPVFYTLSFVGDGPARSIVLLNPLTHLIGFSRTLIIDGKVFPVNWFLLFFLINALLIYLAFKVFKQYESRFAENV
jgi:ABC-type polysaccharide/polyol phosphate export permease